MRRYLPGNASALRTRPLRALECALLERMLLALRAHSLLALLARARARACCHALMRHASASASRFLRCRTLRSQRATEIVPPGVSSLELRCARAAVLLPVTHNRRQLHTRGQQLHARGRAHEQGRGERAAIARAARAARASTQACGRFLAVSFFFS